MSLGQPTERRPHSSNGGGPADRQSRDADGGRSANADSVDAEAAGRQVGQVIDDRYRITGVLGRGGMGTVYAAEHVIIRRPVALKILRRELAELTELSRRFEREAFAIGRLAHPNCVEVSDSGKAADGTLFLAMERVDGTLLSTVLGRESTLEFRRAAHIVGHILRGLAHAHRAGIVHRDIKPENIILVECEGDSNFAKILDFGIAKLIGEAALASGSDGTLTSMGTTFGTPAYMPPEQALGGPIDGRADLYAVSVLFFELITGAVPFRGADRLELVKAHTVAPVPRMADVVPGVVIPESVEAIIRRGLAKQPADRMDDADHYLAELERALAASPSWNRSRGISAGDSAAVSRPDLPASNAERSSHRTERPAGRLFDRANIPIEPRAGDRRPSRPMAVAIGAILIVALAVVLRSCTGAEHAQPTTSEKAYPFLPSAQPPSRPSALAQQAESWLLRGEPQKVIELVEKHPDGDADGHAQLQLAHALAAVGRNRAAISAYRNAVDRTPALDRDSTMRIQVALMQDNSDSQVAMAASEFLAVRLGDERARQRLVTTASSHKRMRIRHRARELAEQLQLGDKVDRLRSYSLDLQQGKRCEDRRKIVLKLRELGDPRAIPELLRARDRKGGGILGIGRRRINGCLRQDADEAIAYLEGL